MPTQDCNGLYYIVKPISVYARTSTQGEVQYLIMHALFILYPNYIYMNILQKSVDYRQLHSFLSVVLYDNAPKNKKKGKFFEVERILAKRKIRFVSFLKFRIIIL